MLIDVIFFPCCRLELLTASCSWFSYQTRYHMAANFALVKVVYIYICMYVCIYLYTLHVGKNHLTERVPMCQSILIFLAATSRAEPWDFMRLQWCSPCINAMAVRWAKHSTLLAARRPNSLTPIARCFFWGMQEWATQTPTRPDNMFYFYL